MCIYVYGKKIVRVYFRRRGILGGGSVSGSFSLYVVGISV